MPPWLIFPVSAVLRSYRLEETAGASEIFSLGGSAEVGTRRFVSSGKFSVSLLLLFLSKQISLSSFPVQSLLEGSAPTLEVSVDFPSKYCVALVVVVVVKVVVMWPCWRDLPPRRGASNSSSSNGCFTFSMLP
uniref:Uncharacterized protein n=1 Tax=Rhizophora mucronata TaxID=61149 RepID=A0A2P2J9U4_RHIMU